MKTKQENKMENNITTEIYKSGNLWNIILREKGKYITTISVKTKTYATKLVNDEEAMKEHLVIGKILGHIK